MYTHYTTPDTTFLLNLDFDIRMDHEARFISYFVDPIPELEMHFPTKNYGRPTHHPRMM